MDFPLTWKSTIVILTIIELGYREICQWRADQLLRYIINLHLRLTNHAILR